MNYLYPLSKPTNPSTLVRQNLPFAVNILKQATGGSSFTKRFLKELVLPNPGGTYYQEQPNPNDKDLTVTEEDFKFLISALSDNDPEIVIGALTIISELQFQTQETVNHLKNVLSHKNAKVQIAAINTLAKIGPKATDTVPDLIEIFESSLRSKEYKVTIACANTLGKIGIGAKDSVAVLVKGLDSPNLGVKIACANALSRFGPYSRDAVPALTTGVNSANPGVKIAYANALGKIGPAAYTALPALERALRKSIISGNRTVTRYIEIAIKEINPNFSIGT